MPFIDRALRGSWSSIANDSSGVLRFVANLGSKETATRNSSQQQPNNNQQQLTTTNQNKNKNRNKKKDKNKNKNNKQPQREQELEAKTAATVQEHNLRMSKQDASWEQKKQNMMRQTRMMEVDIHTELFWRWNWFANMETKRNYRYMKITPAEMMWNNVDRIEQKQTGV